MSFFSAVNPFGLTASEAARAGHAPVDERTTDDFVHEAKVKSKVLRNREANKLHVVEAKLMHAKKEYKALMVSNSREAAAKKQKKMVEIAALEKEQKDIEKTIRSLDGDAARLQDAQRQKDLLDVRKANAAALKNINNSGLMEDMSEVSAELQEEKRRLAAAKTQFEMDERINEDQDQLDSELSMEMGMDSLSMTDRQRELEAELGENAQMTLEAELNGVDERSTFANEFLSAFKTAGRKKKHAVAADGDAVDEDE